MIRESRFFFIIESSKFQYPKLYILYQDVMLNKSVNIFLVYQIVSIKRVKNQTKCFVWACHR